MIDLLSITLDIRHTPFGSVRTIERENNDKPAKTKHLSIKAVIHQVPILVTSLGDGNQINIRCCPLKVFQGHNIFGTNQVNKLGNELIDAVLNYFGISASENQLSAWARGEYAIDEIHLTHRFPVESRRIIRRVVSHIHKYSSMSLAPSIIDKGVGVTIKAPHGLAEWIFYDKCREFGDKRKNEHKYLESRAGEDAAEAGHLLYRLASKSIRAELKLSKAYLKKHGLDRGVFWTDRMVKKVYLHELILLRLGEIPSLPEMLQVYKAIDNAKLRSVLILWANGEDISEHYGRTTLEKHRRAIREELGIDILKDEPVLKRASIKLSDIFDPSNMLIGFPKWARKYPALAFR